MTDLPFSEIVEMVRPLWVAGHTFYQKFTCGHCGSRQTMGEPNVLFKSGRCEECNKITIVDKCGLMIIYGINNVRPK